MGLLMTRMDAMMIKVDGMMSRMGDVLAGKDGTHGGRSADVGVEKVKVKKMEKEQEKEDEEKVEELSFKEGVQGKVVMRGMVRKWFVDKGFGFVEVKGYSVFCHADRVVGQDWLRVGQEAWVKVMEDKARGEGSAKGAQAWRPTGVIMYIIASH